MISRENADKISSLMGTYLLQGYTLLDDYCNSCKTPLMRKTLETPFCIYCDRIKKKSDNEERSPLSEKKSRMETLAMISDDEQSDENNLTAKIRLKMQKVIMNLTEELENQSTNLQQNLHASSEKMSLLLEMIDKTIVAMKKL
ncbi:hypothetical protein DERP_002992 [Dermatophagoides pteronyssinus]|uniref:Sjoegren syndrome/scleroderma autoantigen 1-like n=1 Tax=Dermatophagoides pteronyssinus TaxID=6956 RepID=A0ABQ8JWA5_DERPT|nr:hypothetical protein DERP_002992 [Dermatophagoides pteronyssinus]